MELMQWKDIYSVGDDIIDSQHKKLFDMINHMIVHRQDSVHCPSISDLLNEMLEYAHEHFEYEEQYMLKMGFDQLDAHKQLHKRFEIKTLSFCAEVAAGHEMVPYEILKYLINWLMDHILICDMKYKNFAMK